ncbi:MAG: glycosyltransferase family 4 protein [Egibacteraceae bacterium]
MRVLQIHTRYRQAGGEDLVVEAEAALLRAAGHDVIEWHAENPAQPLAAAADLARSAWNTSAARGVGEVARRRRPDVAHVHNTWFALSPSVLAALRRACVPVVMTLHNYRLVCVNGLLFRDGRVCDDCIGGGPWPAVRHRCYRSSVVASTVAAASIEVHRRLRTWQDNVALFLTPTEFTREQLVASGLDREQVRVKPHFVADPGPRPAAPSTARTVLFVGRLSAEKGLAELLDAWSAAETDGLDLLLLGEGPLRSELGRGLPAGVRLTGRVSREQLRETMLRSRALVFPSRAYETFGLVLAEAMAAGLPPLASDLGAGGELARLVGDGCCVSGSGLDGWVEGLHRLRDDAFVDAMSGRARSVYEQRFTPSQGLRQLLEAYESVAA